MFAEGTRGAASSVPDDSEHEPASDPYDNANCESFLKTLKREEIYANTYRDLEHLRTNMAAFIDEYYNRIRLHSALGYRPREEFERPAAGISGAASMRFFRLAEDLN